MTIYTGPVFEMARQQFQVIADHLEIPDDERDRLLYPKRADHRVLPDPSRRRPHWRCSTAIACSTT